MACSKLFNHSNLVSFTFSDESHGRSKAQMSLKKIIYVITSSPSIEPSSLNLKLELQEVKGQLREEIQVPDVAVDLNLRLGTCLEKRESGDQNTGLSSACSGVGGKNSAPLEVVGDDVSTTEKKSSGAECNSCKEMVEDETRELSEITTNIQVQSSEMETDQVSKGNEGKEESKIDTKEEQVEGQVDGKLPRSEEGYLGLLVEAARLVSGNFGESEKKKKGKGPVIRGEAKEKTEIRNETGLNRCGSKRSCEKEMLGLYEAFVDVTPVVRSKRGRNQVLPARYRDSVLEPLNRPSSRSKPRKK